MFWFIYLRPKFSIRMPYLFIIKICFIIKVNSICGAGRDTKNLCHKSNSQSPALRILDLRVANLKSQGSSSGVLGVRVPVPGSWVSGSRVVGSWSTSSQIPESRIPGLRVQGSQVSVSQGRGSQCPRVPGLRVAGFQVSGSQGCRVPGPGSQGLRVLGPRSWF